MKIAICTPYNTDPLHPRTELLTKVLETNHQVTIFSIHQAKKTFLNRLVLGFYDLSAISKLIKKIKPFDLIYIQDLKFLPLALFAGKRKVIYESLDNNVFLLFFLLVKKYPILKYFAIIPWLVSKSEKLLARCCTDKIIVNSRALQEYLNNKAELLFYTSPLEGIANDCKIPASQPGFLYLGWFCKMKGAERILDFVENQNLPFFIFGSINEPDIMIRIKKNSNIRFYERMNSHTLKTELREFFGKYFLFGFSVTQDVNRSNATQELNKDIDYLCMGVPIIGNKRGPTEEKIKKGLGFFLEDSDSFRMYVTDHEKQCELSENCKNYYTQKYSYELFSRNLQKIVSDVAGIH